MYEDFFRERLSELRNSKGVSARDMSLSIGQNAGYINNIENGKSLPSMNGFFYICDYLGVTPKDFFDTENNNPQLFSEFISDCKRLNNTSFQILNDLVHELLR